jgi:hypothetical protein
MCGRFDQSRKKAPIGLCKSVSESHLRAVVLTDKNVKTVSGRLIIHKQNEPLEILLRGHSRIRCVCATGPEKQWFLPLLAAISRWIKRNLRVCLIRGMGHPTCESGLHERRIKRQFWLQSAQKIQIRISGDFRSRSLLLSVLNTLWWRAGGAKSQSRVPNGSYKLEV